MPQPLFIPRVHICCEPFQPYLSRLQQKTKSAQRRFVYLGMDWQQVVDSLPSGSVDTVVLIDVVEHVDKKFALSLLERTLPLARKQVLISTPLGFCPQHYEPGEYDAWGMQGTSWQEHHSGWDLSDFDDRWTLLACKEYHHSNGKGEKLDPPMGMFWAIYNAQTSNMKPRFRTKPPFRRLGTALVSAWREFRDRMSRNAISDEGR
jgi:hypothetical protein